MALKSMGAYDFPSRSRQELYGDDQLAGGAGDDMLFGQLGDDVVVVEAEGAEVVDEEPREGDADRDDPDATGSSGMDAVPITAYLWTYFSSVMAHAVFFGRPSVALTGGLLMGVIAIPLLVVEIRGRRAGV